jgi:hypothetical protein
LAMLRSNSVRACATRREHPPLGATAGPKAGLVSLVGCGDSRPGVPSHEPGQPPTPDPQSRVEGLYTAKLGARTHQ